MKIINSNTKDIDTIFTFYDYAIAFQKTKFNKHWQGFDIDLIEKEIQENRQWKIMMDDVVVAIFAITFNDAIIWGERDEQTAIYIHRIVTHPNYRGNNFVHQIIIWAKKYCKQINKDFIRLDTWGDNQPLIDYYVKCGFTFLGLSPVINTTELPKHYQGLQLSLFQIKVEE
jgi:GNAT superfamily N-acetyltransferase